MPAGSHIRENIYYWKCDRPASLYGTGEQKDHQTAIPGLQAVLEERYPGSRICIKPAGGQGNHIIFIVRIDGTEYFARIEDGPEGDDYIEVESRILNEVGALHIPTPGVLAVDASRKTVPFAWQIMDLIEAPDLNQLLKRGELDIEDVAEDIGRAVGRWQAVKPPGFGPFSPHILRQEDRLEGFHADYADYYFLHLDRHLDYLVAKDFLRYSEAKEILAQIRCNSALLHLEQGCLVHKDLALWNILGTSSELLAFIDWDDAICGDPMDDLSLLGCFYDGTVLARALHGYASVRPLPAEFRRRFWLHILRNMLVKAVIRVGAGYFEKGEDFFLIGAGSSGADLKSITQRRLNAAFEGLRNDLEIE